MEKNKIIGVAIIILAVIIAIAAIIIARPKKKAKVKEDLVTTKVKTDKKQAEKKTKAPEKKFPYVRFYDAEKASDSEDLYAEFEEEMTRYMSDMKISKITPLNLEEITYAEGEEIKNKKELVVPVYEGKIAQDFSFRFSDQYEDVHVCQYSVFSKAYTISPEADEEPETMGTSEDEVDMLSMINVVFDEDAEKQIKAFGMKTDDIIKAVRQEINDEGYLGEVRTVKIAHVEEAKHEHGYYMTGFMDDENESNISVLYKNKMYLVGIGDDEE